MMAIPNLIALALLSPIVYRLTKDYIKDVNAVDIDLNEQVNSVSKKEAEAE